jgi:hypothetical protein
VIYLDGLGGDGGGCILSDRHFEFRNTLVENVAEKRPVCVFVVI